MCQKMLSHRSGATKCVSKKQCTKRIIITLYIHIKLFQRSPTLRLLRYSKTESKFFSTEQCSPRGNIHNLFYGIGGFLQRPSTLITCSRWNSFAFLEFNSWLNGIARPSQYRSCFPSFAKKEAACGIRLLQLSSSIVWNIHRYRTTKKVCKYIDSCADLVGGALHRWN